MNQFPQITISGEAFERGRQHGQQLKSAIAKTIDFYRSIFALSESEILRHAENFQELILAFSPDYMEEINGIAVGADVDVREIVALNARTEILSHKIERTSNECTSVYFPQQSILGQNWDWGRALESLTVLMRIVQPCGHIIRMITEPGIIGKIGMNSRGLGVCLNILTLGERLKGLPVHIVLRALLDCQSFNEAKSLLELSSHGKASNVIVADADGNGLDVEFCGNRFFILEPEKDYLVHTNHYLGERLNSELVPDFFSSYARFNRAEKLLEEKSMRNLAVLKEILSDAGDSRLPIYREYIDDDSVHELGTVCSIVMSLPDQKMFIRKGKSEGARFFEYGLD